jgi:hypothetical protein
MIFCSHQLILQIGLCKTFVASAAESMAADQFADASFDSVSLQHHEFKFWALLFPTSLLQGFVQSSPHDRAMRLSARNADTLNWTVSALPSELEAVSHFAALLLG